MKRMIRMRLIITDIAERKYPHSTGPSAPFYGQFFTLHLPGGRFHNLRTTTIKITAFTTKQASKPMARGSRP